MTTEAEVVDTLRGYFQEGVDRLVEFKRTDPDSSEEDAMGAVQMGPTVDLRLYAHEIREIGRFDCRFPPPFNTVAMQRHWVYVRRGESLDDLTEVYALSLRRRLELLRNGVVTVQAFKYNTAGAS